MRFIIAIGIALALAGCGDNGGGSMPNIFPSIQGPPCPPPAPTQWEFQCSIGTTGPTVTGETVSFTIPVGTTAVGQPAVHYLVRPGSPMAGRISANWLASIAGGGRFQFITSATNTCGGPAQVSLYFQRRGDDWNGGAETQYYRWFAIGRAELAAGDGGLMVALEPGNWASVLGIKGDQVPAQFAAAIADPMAVGLTFGGGCFAGHGANISGGSATFALTGFSAE